MILSQLGLGGAAWAGLTAGLGGYNTAMAPKQNEIFGGFGRRYGS